MFDHGIIVILHGNLAPEGAVAKVAGLKQRSITGPAKVFDGEEACFQAIQARKIVAGDVVVIRGEGPVGGPGMREMLSITGALIGSGAGRERGAHHRWPLQRRHARARCRPRRPEAWVGGPIALVQNGDSITIDADKKLLTLNVPDTEMQSRKAKWKLPGAARRAWRAGEVRQAREIGERGGGDGVK